MQLKSRPTKGLVVINYKSMTKLGVREFLKLKFYREFKFSISNYSNITDVKLFLNIIKKVLKI